jgi:hypothetical protein
MPEISNEGVLDVTMDDLPEDLRNIVQQACDQYLEKCMMSFSKNKSNRVIQKQSLPRVLLPHQTDYTEEEDTWRMAKLIYKALGDTMTNHHSAFLNTFHNIMINTFGPTADRYFEETIGPVGGLTYFNMPKNQEKSAGSGGSSGSGEAPKGAPAPTESRQQQDPMTYGQLTFGTTGNVPPSAFRVSPASSRLQRNMYGDGYQEFVDYNSLNALPNPGYKNASGQPSRG